MTVGDRPVVSSIPFKENGAQGDLSIAEAIAKGTASGAVGFASGYIAVSATSIVAIRGSTYVEQGSEAQREIVSSSASDAAAGVGARTVQIVYYDNTMAGPFTETVTLNGTNAVTTVAANIRFIEHMCVQTVGSNGTNVGTITLRVLSGGATIGTIAPDDGRTYWAHHYVGANRACFIGEVTIGIIDNALAGTIRCGTFLRKSRPLVANAFDGQITPTFRQASAENQTTHRFERGLWVAGAARITQHVRPDANTASVVHGGFTFYDT